MMTRLLCLIGFLTPLVVMSCTKQPTSTSRRGEASSTRGIGSSVVAPVPDYSSKRRIALVIGNADYQKPLRQLTNPIPDAQGMAEALSELGFELIGDGAQLNQKRREMSTLIEDFTKELNREGGVGVFYYAGHGGEDERGKTLLLPVDFQPIRKQIGPDRWQVTYQKIELENEVLKELEITKSQLNLVIIDACRDRPKVLNTKRSSKNQTLSTNVPMGTLIAYATSPGEAANDNIMGSNGTYTGALLNHIRTAGLKVEDMFKRVRLEVQRESGGAQISQEVSQLTGQFYFKQSKCIESCRPSCDAHCVQAEKKRIEAQKRTLQAEKKRIEAQKRILQVERQLKIQTQKLKELERQRSEELELKSEDLMTTLSISQKVSGHDIPLPHWAIIYPPHCSVGTVDTKGTQLDNIPHVDKSDISRVIKSVIEGFNLKFLHLSDLKKDLVIRNLFTQASILLAFNNFDIAEHMYLVRTKIYETKGPSLSVNLRDLYLGPEMDITLNYDRRTHDDSRYKKHTRLVPDSLSLFLSENSNNIDLVLVDTVQTNIYYSSLICLKWRTL